MILFAIGVIIYYSIKSKREGFVMDILLSVVRVITIVLGVFSAPLMIWMIITTLRGFGKPKELVKSEEKLHNFAIIVCARNEENVIANLLNSIKRQDYAGKYQVFVIADNCTDDTAGVSEKNGAVVFKRFNAEKRGKGFALHYGINRILKLHEGEYDAMCVFDADNLASANFLTEMNNALCSGGDVALGYRDTKNIHDSWVSEVYSIYWLMLQRFYHNPRHAMGISSMVGGTGFAFKIASLGEEGWNTDSITEDVEFSIQQVVKGHKIVPANKARFYDEQPADFGVSVKQRLRWMTGGMQCIPLYLKEIFKTVFKGNARALDLAWYILFIPATGLAIPLNITSAITLVGTPGLQPFALLAIVGCFSLSIVFAWLIAFSTLKLEKREMKGMGRGILLYPVFMFTMMVLAFAALVRPRTEWVPIKHDSSRTIEELE